MSISTKERFNLITQGKRPGDVLILDWFHKTLVDTPAAWVAQGAPKKLMSGSMLAGNDYQPMNDYFGYEHLHALREIISGIFRLDLFKLTDAQSFYATLPVLPPFKRVILEENDLYQTERHFSGEIMLISKKNPWGMPRYLEYPVRNRKTWNEYKKRLEPSTPSRLPDDWNNYVDTVNNEPFPNLLSFCGFFGPLRNMIGLEKLLFMFYDDPALVEEMMEHFFQFNCEIAKMIFSSGLKVDTVMIWEDMAYNAGPLISPKMFQKLIIPRYRKFCSLLQEFGVEIICVDSDGNINELITPWIETGVNCFWPLEVAAGMNSLDLRRKYGQNLIMIGNIDKRALLKNEETVKNEVMSKVPLLVKDGGYIPCIDHNIGPDIPLHLFHYYLKLLKQIGANSE